MAARSCRCQAWRVSAEHHPQSAVPLRGPAIPTALQSTSVSRHLSPNPNPPTALTPSKLCSAATTFASLPRDQPEEETMTGGGGRQRMQSKTFSNEVCVRSFYLSSLETPGLLRREPMMDSNILDSGARPCSLRYSVDLISARVTASLPLRNQITSNINMAGECCIKIYLYYSTSTRHLYISCPRYSYAAKYNHHQRNIVIL